MGSKAKNCQVTEDNSQQPAEVDGSQECDPELGAGYDSYRSLADPNLIIFVPKHAVPPFRFKVGGWELLQSLIDLDSAAKAGVAEKGFFIDKVNPMTSGDQIPSDEDRPESSSLEVEFALVIARMIDSVRNRPEDIRQIVYDLARYKLQEQLLQATPVELEQTRRALEGAIRGVEAFSQKHVYIPAPERQSQLNGTDTTLISTPVPSSNPARVATFGRMWACQWKSPAAL